MRGARGLLISICGGPDLTLYEVDEAATRIREEVDPEANIILGATFDDALEGTMRVSVVATGLASEAKSQGHHHEASNESTKTSYGYQPIPQPTVKVVKPAPMVARAAPAPAPQVEMQEEEAPAEEYYEEEMEAAPIPQPAVQRQATRIPPIEQFPRIAREQVAAQQSRIENIAEHAQRRKKGIFERLADVGLGRRDEGQQTQRPQAAQARRAEPKIQAQRPAPQPEPQAEAEQAYDDDQLAIPAFLRRQAT
jgi:cell division protein FtsZ